ncbi:MAG: hypothetical protein AUH11_14520 [Acidobacteria bacterium 13_2_20CM_57_17]|nr:MAG: hypothetical protein AUH11_14520 [Acidobacteria bacterium 13_2_20CM_57_17]OLB95193.1 MAG: hypothetical protein AUI02_03985 [Acidobacteria bacterium 13_2_20CM_2_57_12]
MGNKSDSSISRREFARRAAFASAAASLVPAELLNSQTAPAPLPAQQHPNSPKLSPESQAEVESRIQAIFAQYGKRLSDAQKTDIRRLATEAQPPLDRLRAFATDNGDGPGLYLKPLIERERKPTPMPATPRAASTPKGS